MVSPLSVSQIFNNLKADPENTICFECSAQNPTFVSVNNGCIICSNCVQSHLPLGSEVSRIKPVDSEWSEPELRLIIAGGNSSLKEFFNHYNIANTPPNFKYMTRAAFFYRDMLSVVAEDREYEQTCPDLPDGIQLVASVYPELPIHEEVKAVPIEPVYVEERKNEESGQKKSAWQWAKSSYNKAMDASNKAVEKINKKINEISDRPAIKKMENKTMELAGKFESGVNSIWNKVTSKPAVKDALDQANHAADSFAKEVSYNYTKINSNPSVQKLKVDTMNLLKDLVSNIKGNPQP